MNLPFGKVLAPVVALWLATSPALAEDGEATDLFRRAIENQSTAPSFVLISIVTEGGRLRDVAVPAPYLLGAIHTEFHLRHDHKGIAKAKEIALAQPNRAFEFRNPLALKNVKPSYSESDLAKARAQLDGLSDTKILTGFQGGSGALDAIYSRLPGRKYTAMRDAMAHIIIERGFLVGHGCRAGYLTVKR